MEAQKRGSIEAQYSSLQSVFCLFACVSLGIVLLSCNLALLRSTRPADTALSKYNIAAMGSQSQTPSGIDPLVSLLTNLGIDTSDMSLNEAQRLVSTARTGQLTLPASSYQVPQTTIETRPSTHTAQVQDQDTIPLTMLQRPVMDEESTGMAEILAASAAVATPLPASPAIPLTTFSEGEQVQPPSSTAAPATAKAPPPSVFVPYPEGACFGIRPRRRRAPEAIVSPTAMQDVPNLPPVRRTRDYANWTEADTAPTAQRQRMNPNGDY
eukprot:2209342-Amphidinium_carterae.1